MNEIEHLLTVLAEEACEVAERACKAIRFGMTEIEPDQPDDNRRRIQKELADVVATAELLGFTILEEDKAAKREKLKKFMDYARKLGTLEQPQMDWAICGWCAGTGKEERTSVVCPKCKGAGGKKLEKAGNAWAPNQDYPGKPVVTKPTPESALGREMTSIERILIEAVNEFCSCGGAGPENGCTACKIWHRHVAAARKA